MNFDKIRDVARQAALEAGNHLKCFYGQRPDVAFKGAVDLVTDRDRECQDIIHRTIQKNFPGHSILAEEDLNVEKDKELLWVVDPLDGTINFAHSLPMFSVSIAFQVEGDTRVGVVYIPVLDEMFHGIRGSGAFLGSRPLGVSKEKDIGNCLLATGFPYDRRDNPSYVDNIKKFLVQVRGLRRMGSAAIDICYTAAGRFDGFWEPKLHPWDTAAAYMLVEEAGGRITDFSGNPYNPFMKECTASNSLIHQQMLDIINQSSP